MDNLKPILISSQSQDMNLYSNVSATLSKTIMVKETAGSEAPGLEHVFHNSKQRESTLMWLFESQGVLCFPQKWEIWRWFLKWVIRTSCWVVSNSNQFWMRFLIRETRLKNLIWNLWNLVKLIYIYKSKSYDRDDSCRKCGISVTKVCGRDWREFGRKNGREMKGDNFKVGLKHLSRCGDCVPFGGFMPGFPFSISRTCKFRSPFSRAYWIRFWIPD